MGCAECNRALCQNLLSWLTACSNIFRVAGPNETYILAVDDDDSVLSFIATVLRLEGHRVVTAASGPQAIEIAAKGGAPLGLLITDIVMPDMDGYALAAQVVERNPSLPVLYVSGFTEREVGARSVVPAAGPLLGKPFSADELRAVVRRLLGKSSVPAPRA